MINQKPTLVILAGGIGKRYGGLKQIDPIGPHGEIVIDYAVFDALRAGFGKVVFVIRREIEREFRSVIEPHLRGRVLIEYAYQDLSDLPENFQAPAGRAKPWGTAHAVWACRRLVNEPFGVINADDFYGRASYEHLARLLGAMDAALCSAAIVPFTLRNTLSENGPVSRGICRLDEEGRLLSVVERVKIESDGRGGAVFDEDGRRFPLSGDEPASLNFWGFTPPFFEELTRLFAEFLKLNAASPSAEFFIPTVVDILIREKGLKVSSAITGEQWRGVTYPADKPGLTAWVQELIQRGVYPENLWGKPENDR